MFLLRCGSLSCVSLPALFQPPEAPGFRTVALTPPLCFLLYKVEKGSQKGEED